MPELPPHKPLFLQLDNDELAQKPDEALFNKNLTFDNNKNKGADDGTNNNANQGQNQWVLTPVQSNVAIPDVDLPDGFNKSSAFESIVSNEVYHFNFNSNGNHGIYVIDGNTLTWQTVIIDSELQLSDDQEAFVANHRVELRVVLDDSKNIIEKFLVWTDGQAWQKWVSVMAAIATDGFNVATFPYWTLQPPHFDRRELVEYAVRPPMTIIEAEPIDNTDEDLGKPNRVLDMVFRAQYLFYYTDGRSTCASPWSLPFYVKREDFLNNPDLISKKFLWTLYAGSCMVEKIELYVQKGYTDKSNSTNETIWGDVYRYDTINAFDDNGNVLGTDYWLRTGKWANYNYDATFNTIEYVFDNSKVGQIVDQAFIGRIQNDIPIRSVAMSPLGDATLLANNEIGFDNFETELLEHFDIEVEQGTSTSCNVPLRNISLYAYAGLHGDHVENEYFISQFPYYRGDDTQMRFGGIQFAYAPITVPVTILKSDTDQSDQFNLDFADRKSFRCYLKGTPYYADGQLHYVTTTGVLVPVTQDLNILDIGDRQFIYNIFADGGYFIFKFEFLVPAGVYSATLARHNTPSNQDWIGTSTYIMGIADSQNTTSIGYGTLTFNALAPYTAGTVVSNRKEQLVDCRSADVDVWGNGEDLFYVFVPSPLFEDEWPDDTEDAWTFIEGYLKETSEDGALGMELYPYIGDEGNVDENYGGGLYGEYGITDKNGFFFFYSGRGDANDSNVDFWGNKNCTYYPREDTFISTALGSDHRGWHQNQNLYFSNINGGNIGDCNRILVTGRITNLSGSLGYSNVAVSITYGGVALTNDNGEFTLVAHEGLDTGDVPTRYILINAAGDYTITLADCVLLDKYDYEDPECVYTSVCQVRVFEINNGNEIQVKIDGGGQQSLKTEATYPVGIIGADLAGRVTFVNLIENVTVPSFMDLNAVVPQSLTWVQAAFALFPDDIKWVAFAVAKDTSKLRYVQWVGDSIKYIDAAGNITTDAASAKLLKISIQSLFNANVASNFSLLANYQFQEGDRVRFFDNGDGQLFDTATYGDVIDLQIVGQNYNQAAINAGLLPTTELVTPLTTDVSIYIEYNSTVDARLKNKNGFWIELYTPSQVNVELPYFEVGSFYPVIDNKIAEYTGGGVSAPAYNFLLTDTIPYWDTYFLRRSINIDGIGNKYFWHPFESPNITDNWGKNITSGGRPNKVEPFAKRQWYNQHTIKSDDFLSNGLKNGLGIFRNTNVKEYKRFGAGGIVSVLSQYNVVLLICENDWFTAYYDFKFTKITEQGLVAASLSDNLSDPREKVGGNFGCAYEHTGTVIALESVVGWYDVKNGQFVLCNYGEAKPISDAGIKSYLIAKSVAITQWNYGKDKEFKFDVVAGIDFQNDNIYLTFRPRRNNSQTALSFVNRRRDLSLLHQETLVYNVGTQRWTRTVGFTPESYISLRGKGAVQEMFTFAAGKPHYHNNTAYAVDYCKFYNVQTEIVLKFAINDEPDFVKALKTLAYDCLGVKLYCDLIYESQRNSFSYIPLNLFKTKKKVNYAAVLRDASSYPNYTTPSWLSPLIDGMKRMFGQFFVVRLVGDLSNKGKYGELSSIYKRVSQSGNNKK